MADTLTEAAAVLEEIQERTGWSLGEIAYQLRFREGVAKTPATIANWRSGDTQPRIDEFRALERLLSQTRRLRSRRVTGPKLTHAKAVLVPA